MSKTLLNLINYVATTSIPFQTVAPISQKENPNYNSEILQKIERVGDYKDSENSNVDKPIEVLVRIKDNVIVNKDDNGFNFEEIEKKYNQQNELFADKLLNELDDSPFYSSSSISPFITFIFKSRTNLEKNLIKLTMNSETEKIVSFDSPIEFESKPMSFENIYESTNKTVSEINNEIFQTVGLLKQIEKERNSGDTTSKEAGKKLKVGIFEAEATVTDDNPNFSNKNFHYYKENRDTYAYTVLLRSRGKFDHADHVASVFIGNNGVDKYIKDVYTTFEKYSYTRSRGIYKDAAFTRFLSKMDWMVKSGVEVINNSRSDTELKKISENEIDEYGYNFLSYYLDYIARKYGVINVFSSGNSANDAYAKSINSYSLSQNSIVVGSTDIKGTKRSEYSEFKSADYKILTKPLVVAPGEDYPFSSIESDKNPNQIIRSGSGTSFSAPLVSGMITTLIRNNPKLSRKPEAFLAITTAGANEIKGYVNNKDNGLNVEVGAGLINYEKMQKAADNLKFMELSSGSSMILPWFELKKGNQINISTAWLYNAGFLEQKAHLPKEPNYPDSKKTYSDLTIISGLSIAFPFLLPWQIKKFVDLKNEAELIKNLKKAYLEERNKYIDDHNFESNMNDMSRSVYVPSETDWESIEKLKEKYSSGWYTPIDIDLVLEKYVYDSTEETNVWKTVASSTSSTSNVEFVRYNVPSDGYYRIRVYRLQSDNKEKNKEKVKGAVTYVIN